MGSEMCIRDSDRRAGDEEAHRWIVDIDAASGSSASAWCAVLLQGAGADERHGCVQQLGSGAEDAFTQILNGCPRREFKGCPLLPARASVLQPLAHAMTRGLCAARLVLTESEATLVCL